MRKKLIVLTTILGLIAFSGVAAAAEETEDTGDTFNFGYDEPNGVFIWGSSPSDGDDCALENGSLEVVYGDSTDGGLLEVDLASIEYQNCQLTGGGEVAGPQGQVNHGMFLKTLNAMFDGQARGCMIRHIAQSDMGKGDQQVNVPDVDPEAEGVEPGDTGTVDFETVITDCLHGRDQQVEGQSNGKGRPQSVTDKLEDKHGDDDSGRRGPPDHAQGPKG